MIDDILKLHKSGNRQDLEGRLRQRRAVSERKKKVIFVHNYFHEEAGDSKTMQLIDNYTWNYHSELGQTKSSVRGVNASEVFLPLRHVVLVATLAN